MALSSGQIPKVAIVGSSNTVLLGSNTNGASAYTAGSQGGRVMSLTAVTDDTVTINVFVWILRSSTVIPLGLVNVPASSGNTNAARFNVDFLDGVNIVGLPIDNTGKRYIPLLANDVLRVGALVNLTAAKTVWVHASGNDYQV
jgi:hypothetical protein